MKGATEQCSRFYTCWLVSIHTPVKGATVLAPPAVKRLACFNPHAREGRDTEPTDKPVGMVVSIHTPVKGATFKP